MAAADYIALGSTVVALAALVLTAYLQRLNLAHQRMESHRGRVWERKVEVLLELLLWVEEVAGADPVPVEDGMSVDHYTPRMPASLHTRVAPLAPELNSSVARAQIALGRAKFTLAVSRRTDAGWDEAAGSASEAELAVDKVRTLAQTEIQSSPHWMGQLRPHLRKALDNQ